METKLLEEAKKKLDKLSETDSGVKKSGFDIRGRKCSLFWLGGACDNVSAAALIGSCRQSEPDPEANVYSQIFLSVEFFCSRDPEKLRDAVLSGMCVLFCEGESEAAAADLRRFPARGIEEPDKSKTLRGPHEGFTEALGANLALIRKRIRSETLRAERFTLGRLTKTEAALVYMDGRADEKTVVAIRKKLSRAKLNAVSMAQETVAEALFPGRLPRLNPFPKLRFVERPDTACAMLVEGKVLVICDTSPAVIVLPMSVFDFFEETDDYYFPSLTGTYMRVVRLLVFLATVYLAPVWLWATMHADVLPDLLGFVGKIDGPYTLPIFLQLLVIEFAIDGLKLASLNTPSTLSNSLSVVGGLLLGDYAVKSGWFVPQTILYSAFTAMANFVPSNLELGYCFKFERISLIILTQLFGLWGIAGGTLLFFALTCLTKTADGKSYLYPLIPFDRKALLRILVRTGKGREELDREKQEF
ncbi:MAG: spore germination protein [Clostridia bacterium]|nr:spore germination protein [Clostridia bacterium]